MATLSSPTLQNLITSVRRLLNSKDSKNSFWSDEELTDYLNEAVRLYFTECVLVNEGYFTTTTDLNLVANTELVSLPADCFEVKQLFRKVTDGYISLNYANSIQQSYSTSDLESGNSYTPSYYFRGNSLVLRPIPGLSETAGLKLEYIQFPDTMVWGGDSLTSQVSPVFKQVIEMYAVYKAKLKESLVNNVNTSSVAESNLAQLYKTFKDTISKRSKGPTYVIPFNP